MDDDNLDWERRYNRDLNREPTYGKRQRIPLIPTGTVKQRFCPGESALHASTAKLLERHCDGCDQDEPDVVAVVVTHHDDTKSKANYCGACLDLARMDWNGETRGVEVVL